MIQKYRYDDHGQEFLHLQALTKGHLASWQQDLGTVIDTALHNVNRYRPSPQSVSPGVWVLDQSDQFSSPLHFEQIRNLPGLRGKPVVFLTNKDYSIISSSDDVIGLEAATRLADDRMIEAQAVSAQAFVLDDDNKWQNFLPSEEHSLYQEIQLRQLQAKQSQYALLRDLIVERAAQAKLDFFVSTYSVASKNQHTQSSAIWLQDYAINNIIPKTDLIMLSFDNNDLPERVNTSVIPTDKLLEVCRARLKPCPWSSQYIILEGFPSTEELTKLGIAPK